MDNATWAGHTISVYAKCKRRCVQCGGQLLKTEKKKKDKTKTNKHKNWDLCEISLAFLLRLKWEDLFFFLITLTSVG